MFWKRSGDLISISADGQGESLSFGAGELADIRYACAWPGSCAVLLTAARTSTDRASVRENRRGNYRAYSASAGGIERFSDEYTNTAIPLPDNRGIAYSNGTSLVVITDGQRRAYKVGRFNWGPTSVSCNERGNLVAMAKWKGNHRKLVFADLRSNTLSLSRFSFHSYLLLGDAILYVLDSDVERYAPASGQNRSITPQSVRAELLDAVGIRTARVSQAVVSFNDLSLFEGRVIVSAGVHHPETFERFWYGIVQLPYQEHPLGIVAPIERPWRVGNLSSTGDTLCLTLERFENARLAGTRLMAIGRRQECIAAGWRPLAHPRIPDHGFQFLSDA